ncbi:hypothetical protein O0L34_g10211 [Tuta absoluta]|nr:hypothetical protein O0L34_g10211 [Tuta absoluta]
MFVSLGPWRSAHALLSSIFSLCVLFLIYPHETMGDNNKSDDDLADLDLLSDSEVVDRCEQELNKMTDSTKKAVKANDDLPASSSLVGKRKEREDDDDFVEVRKPRRRPSTVFSVPLFPNMSRMNFSFGATFEVCVTSTKNLPKQMALAKLLREENIEKITRIRYKGPYKVLIRFDSRDEAVKLINCQKFIDLECKCQFTFETSSTYGVVKGVDGDIAEAELSDIFESSTKILSVKRLKRINHLGQWTDSETVRICFSGKTPPPFVYAYGCRFKVEAYVFPVTQCSGCWKFGHIVKFCPTRKTVCPKCGEAHANCETKTFICPNCKGGHMALDKSCPIFIKEKKLRKIMSSDNVTYRKALEIYLDNKKDNNRKDLDSNNFETDFPIPRNALCTPSIAATQATQDTSGSLLKPSYTQIVTNAIVHREMPPASFAAPEDTQISHENKNRTRSKQKKKSVPRKGKTMNQLETSEISQEQETLDETTDEEQTKNKKRDDRNGFDLLLFMLKIKKIIVSDHKFEDKMFCILKVIFEQCKLIFLKYVKDGDLFEKVGKMFNG